MPPVSKTQGLSGAERAERTRHFYRLSTPAVGWQLLYVGNAVANLADVDWIPVMGPAPAPRTAPPASKVLLTVDSLQIGRSTKLSAETASQVLSWLLDLSSLRLKSSIRTQPSNWICDTAPHVAMWIHGHAGDAKSLAAVCTAWRNVVQLYRSRWPQDFRRLLQLDVGHGWPVDFCCFPRQCLAGPRDLRGFEDAGEDPAGQLFGLLRAAHAAGALCRLRLEAVA